MSEQTLIAVVLMSPWVVLAAMHARWRLNVRKKAAAAREEVRTCACGHEESRHDMGPTPVAYGSGQCSTCAGLRHPRCLTFVLGAFCGDEWHEDSIYGYTDREGVCPACGAAREEVQDEQTP